MAPKQDGTFLTRVVLRNYKSIASCDVKLGPLTFLVGPNGAGKSNFLDALRLLSESLRTRVDKAVRERGGFGEVLRKGAAPASTIDVEVSLKARDGTPRLYGFALAEREAGVAIVQREYGVLADPESGRPTTMNFGALGPHDPMLDGQLSVGRALSSGAGDQFVPELAPLSAMVFYSPSPEAMSKLSAPDSGGVLAWDCNNIASVLERLSTKAPESLTKITEYLRLFLRDLESVNVVTFGPFKTVQFVQRSEGSTTTRTLLAASMSAGTLRALGILTALFQFDIDHRPRVIGIEEPESALHPGAVGVLLDAFRDASRHAQLVITSHSADLLDDKDVTADELLAVSTESGVTLIGPIDDAGRIALRDRLYTAGELLRFGQLRPEGSSPYATDHGAAGLVADSDR